MHERPYRMEGVKFLAVRGPLSRKMIKEAVVPEVYGDPALLLPTIYAPLGVKKICKVAYIPHYVDRHLMMNKGLNIIDVALPWKIFVRRVLECERIVSSSLHGIIIAEAYGIPAEWAVYSDRVIGNGFKFHDYLLGTGREVQRPGMFPPIPDLKTIQRNLTHSLTDYFL